MQTFKCFTLGCKANQYDTQDIRERFMQAGLREISNGQGADICLINTCTVTGRADAQSFNLIRRARRDNPGAQIIVTGCLAEIDADKIKKISGIGLIVKNKDKKKILPLLKKRANRLTGNRLTGNRQTDKGISFFKGHTRAFLKIQDGCNNFCSYCKVPLVRGRQRSAQKNDVIRQAENLAANGYKEIVLTGICLGAYGEDLKPNTGLVEVIEELEKIKGLLRIRLSSIEAIDLSEGLIVKMSNSEKLCPHLHIPLQSGDKAVLKDMNRRYKKADFLNLVKRAKSKIPRLAITTDVLVGFPSESEKAFRNTLAAVRAINPLKVHIFPYSRREGTLAAEKFKEEIAPQAVRERFQRLKELSCRCRSEYLKKFIGRKASVLIEQRQRDTKDIWQGYSENYLPVRVRCKSDCKNELVLARLKSLNGDYLFGEVIH